MNSNIDTYNEIELSSDDDTEEGLTQNFENENGELNQNQIREWKKFLLNENLEDSKIESDDDDPEYIPPELTEFSLVNLDDSTEMESEISEDELRDLEESLKQDLKLGMYVNYNKGSLTGERAHTARWARGFFNVGARFWKISNFLIFNKIIK